MSIEAMTWALSADVGDATRKLVLIGYANHAHKDGRNSWASKETIAEYVNCSSKTVTRHVKALIAAGWIRLGDQAQVAHVRADRRPVVYDLAMTEATRDAWKSDAEAVSARGDSLSGRESVRGDSLSGRDEVHGGTHGGSPVSARGDKAVSPEPSGTKELPPHPPASGGSADADTEIPDLSAGDGLPCPKHRNQPSPNCRGCGTTPRQIAERQRREAAQRARLAEQQRLADEAAARRAARRCADDKGDLLEQARRALRAGKVGAR